MADKNRLLRIGDKWYHQVGFDSLNLKDDAIYALKRTDKKNVLTFVELDNEALGNVEIDVEGLLTEEKADKRYALKEDFELAHEETHSGVRGDYATHYGIVKVYDKIASSQFGTAKLTIHGGLTVDMPGKATLMTIASNITYTITGGQDCTIFLTNDGSLKEAQELFWQTNKPTPEKATAAWWSPKAKQWSFYFNELWTAEVSAQPLVDVFLTDGKITRLSYAGYRLLDTQVPLITDLEYPELLTNDKTIIGAINEAWDIADTADAIADAAVTKAMPELTTESKYIVGAINEVKTGVDGLNAEIVNISGQLDTIEANSVTTSDYLTLKSSVDDMQEAQYDIATIANNNTTDITTLKNSVGSVVLSTTNKTCTGAITEINNKIGTATLTTQAKTLGGAINELASALDVNKLLHGTASSFDDFTATDLSELVAHLNVLLNVLRARGIIE